MNKRQFIKERKKIWKEFELLVNQFDRKLSRKSKSREVARFSQLFRELANDLATVRAREWDQQLEDYLNNLAAKGHNVFYGSQKWSWKAAIQYITIDYPNIFRKNINYFLLSCFFFFGPLLLTWGLIQQRPDLASRIIPKEQLKQLNSSWSSKTEEGEDDEYSGWETDSIGRYGQERAFMLGFYILHNAGIALTAFAMGLFFGVPTVYTLIFNGIVLGAVSGYVVSAGNGDKFLSFVVTHGSFELTAIAVAGGAGLMLANALIHSQDRTWLDSLLTRGREAVQIAFGAAVMLIVAAFIEAFWSPAPIPAIYKYVVGASMWLLVFLYLGFAGRNQVGSEQ